MSRCPTLEQLEQFLEEEGAETERASVAQHLERCESCQAKMEELTEAVSLAPSVSAVLRRPETSAPAPIPASSQAGFLARLKENPPSRSSRSGSRLETVPTVNVPAKGGTGSKFPEVAGYEILSELGRGGMGVVYKARQVGLDRLAALKMILAGHHAGPKDLSRFRQEAEAVARLRHPNIIQIYDIGESIAEPYLALEFVEGDTLAHLLLGTPQPHLPAARLIETLAGAIHYAHQRNIVHRDLKPANILLESVLKVKTSGKDSGTWTVERGLPKITDFGLAKRLDGHTGGTQSGDLVGTPSYMAPEQAASKGLPVGPAADVYALGAILYELLTGRPPFRGPTPLDTVLQVIHEDPVKPSYLRRDLPRDLEIICLKCLAKEPGKRYASAEALADDLHRFRKGVPIKARPVGLHERIWKWTRQRPLSAGLIASLILVGLLGFAGITWQWQEARMARDHMEIQRELAEQARDNMEFQRERAEEARRNEMDQRQKARVALYFSRIAQSQLQWLVNDFPGAEQSLAKCFPSSGQEDHRGWEWRYLQSLFHNDLFTLPHGHSGQGGSVAYDARGDRIATVVSGPSAGETPLPGEVRIWDARTGGLIHTWSAPSAVHRLTFNPDGKRLALATTDGAVMIWDSASGKEIIQKQMHRQLVSALAFSPDGRTVASSSWDQTVKLWDSASGELRREIRGHDKEIQSVAFHPHKPIIATGSWDTTIKLWDTSTGKEIQTLRGHKLAIYCVAFSPDGQSLVSAGSNGNLKIWDLPTGRIVQSLTGDTRGVLNIAISPDGRYLAKAGKDGTVRIWHMATGVERMSFRGHTSPVESVQFSPDCRRVVSISPGDGLAKVWDLTRHPEYATFARTDADVEAIAFADAGQRLLSVTVGGRLQSWDAATGMLRNERLLSLNQEIVSPAVSVAFSTGGNLLAARAAGDSRVVQLWDTATGREAAACRGHTLPVFCIRFSSDGRHLATCACGKQNVDPLHEIMVWEAATGKQLATFTGKGRIFTVAFSPDGRLLAWGSQNGVLALKDWKSPEQEVKVLGHQGDVSAIAFSPDGKTLTSAGMEDRRIEIWNVADLFAGTAKARQTLAAPTWICDLAFSPDSRRLAAISRDMVKLWEVETGHEALTLRGAAQRYWDPSFNPRLAFSPDGTQLAGTNWDESISTWEAPSLDHEEQFAKFQEKRRRFAEERTSFWHLQEAELCLTHKNASALRFHLNRLDKEALTGSLKTRRDRLEAGLSRLSSEKK